MSTRSGRIRQSLIDTSPSRTLKGISPTRSPARNRKSSPTTRSAQKSPSRKSPSRKSPSRKSPSRKSPSRKSPSRKSASKYPARKSPSRAVKEPKEEKEISVPKSPAKRPALKKNTEFKVVDVSSKVEISRSTRSRRFDYSNNHLSQPIVKVDPLIDEKPNGLDTVHSTTDVYGLRNRKNSEDLVPRRSSWLKDVVDNFSDIRRSVSKSLSKSMSQSIDNYSDKENSEELLPKERSQPITRKLSTPLPSSVSHNRYEYGGKLGSIILSILMPLFVFAILISCSNSCSHTSFLDQLYKSVSKWFSATTSLVTISQFFLQAIFVSLPICGSEVVNEQGKRYYFNGFFSSFCTINLLFTLDYYKVFNVDSLLTSYLSMTTVSYIVAVMLAIILFIKSSQICKDYINPYGNSGFILYDFFMGRQIQDNIMRINVKLYLSRVSNISTLILAILIFKHGLYIEKKEIDSISWDKVTAIISKVQYKPTLLVYSLMQIIYALYFITREKKLISTFYWQSEGLGYLQIVSSSLYPFFFTSVSKYVKDASVELSTNILIMASVTYLLGLMMMLISNNIKYEFRKNPLQSSLTHLESMPTFHGKKLLVSNLWGIMRHPNYTGDILIHIALALPGILNKQMIAASPALLTILILFHRAWRDNHRCRRRYGAAWQRYCIRVPSVLIPKIL